MAPSSLIEPSPPIASEQEPSVERDWELAAGDEERRTAVMFELIDGRLRSKRNERWKRSEGLRPLEFHHRDCTEAAQRFEEARREIAKVCRQFSIIREACSTKRVRIRSQRICSNEKVKRLGARPKHAANFCVQALLQRCPGNDAESIAMHPASIGAGGSRAWTRTRSRRAGVRLGLRQCTRRCWR